MLTSAPSCHSLPITCRKILRTGLSLIGTQDAPGESLRTPWKDVHYNVCVCDISHVTCHPPPAGTTGTTVASRHPPKPDIAHVAVTKPQDSKLPPHNSWNPAHFHQHTVSTYCMHYPEQIAVAMTRGFQRHEDGEGICSACPTQCPPKTC